MGDTKTDDCLHCALFETFETWRQEHGNLSPDPSSPPLYSAAVELSGVGQFAAEMIGQAGSHLPPDRFESILHDFCLQLRDRAYECREEIRIEVSLQGDTDSHAHH